MAHIHWRNFERLTTEFFRRQGYEVDLRTGTKDGGLDVRVWTDRDSRTRSLLMLIQCKRHKEVVGIETGEDILTFWSDVHFEGGEKGGSPTPLQFRGIARSFVKYVNSQ